MTSFMKYLHLNIFKVRIHFMRKCCILFALFVAISGCGSLHGPTEEGLVKTYEWRPFLPTGNDYEVLEFRGKRYKHLFSDPYVFVPELDGIIFATRKEGHTIKIHYVPIKGSGEVTVDEGEYYNFGNGLGRSREDPGTQYVESVVDHKITFFSNVGPYFRTMGDTNGRRYVLDLENGTFRNLKPKTEANSNDK